MEEITLSASYATGGLTFGVKDYRKDLSVASGSDIDGIAYGASFAVNDDLTVSADRSSVTMLKKLLTKKLLLIKFLTQWVQWQSVLT